MGHECDQNSLLRDYHTTDRFLKATQPISSQGAESGSLHNLTDTNTGQIRLPDLKNHWTPSYTTDTTQRLTGVAGSHSTPLITRGWKECTSWLTWNQHRPDKDSPLISWGGRTQSNAEGQYNSSPGVPRWLSGVGNAVRRGGDEESILAYRDW